MPAPGIVFQSYRPSGAFVNMDAYIPFFYTNYMKTSQHYNKNRRVPYTAAPIRKQVGRMLSKKSSLHKK